MLCVKSRVATYACTPGAGQGKEAFDAGIRIRDGTNTKSGRYLRTLVGRQLELSWRVEETPGMSSEHPPQRTIFYHRRSLDKEQRVTPYYKYNGPHHQSRHGSRDEVRRFHGIVARELARAPMADGREQPGLAHQQIKESPVSRYT